MKLSKVSDEEKLAISRRYFLCGFALLPFLWLVNGLWFFEQAFIRKPFTQQGAIKKYVMFSLLGCTMWTLVFVIWIVTFQTNRVSWGATGDYLSFVYPRGRP